MFEDCRGGCRGLMLFQGRPSLVLPVHGTSGTELPFRMPSVFVRGARGAGSDSLLAWRGLWGDSLPWPCAALHCIAVQYSLLCIALFVGINLH